jgi:hypothetical protein
MDFKQLTSINFVITKGLQLLSLKQLLDILSVDSLLLAGIQVVTGRMILSHFYSLSTSKPNILLLRTTSMLSIVVHHMVLYLVTITSVYVTTRMVTQIVMFAMIYVTTFLQVQMGMIQY